MGMVKEIYYLVDECYSLGKHMSVSEIIESEKNGTLDDILEDSYSYEEVD